MSFKLKPDEEGFVNTFVRNHFGALPMTPEKLRQASDFAIRLVRVHVLPAGLAHLPIEARWDHVTSWFDFTMDDTSVWGFGHAKGIDVFDTRSTT